MPHAARQARLHALGLESLGALAGGLAHQVNNLLVGVLGNASLALADLPPGAALRRPLELIELSARRAADLTRRLLACAGLARPATTPVDLSAVAEGMRDLLGASLAKGTVLDLRLGRDLPLVDGDAGQLGLVVSNLVAHASQSLGGRPGTVTVATSERTVLRVPPRGVTRVPDLVAGDYVVLEVADTGEGMGALARERLLDPFAADEPVERGLGLAVVQGVAQLHGGAVEIESEPGRGTIVRLYVPRACAQSRPAHAAEGAEDAERPLIRGRGRVLVVDDEARVLRVMGEMLSSLGFDPVLVPDGSEAVARLQALSGDVEAVLLDLVLPGMTGEETFHVMRRVAPFARIVLMSGYEPGPVLARLEDEAPEGFLAKPFTLQALSDRLRQATLRIA